MYAVVLQVASGYSCWTVLYMQGTDLGVIIGAWMSVGGCWEVFGKVKRAESGESFFYIKEFVTYTAWYACVVWRN